MPKTNTVVLGNEKFGVFNVKVLRQSGNLAQVYWGDITTTDTIILDTNSIQTKEHSFYVYPDFHSIEQTDIDFLTITFDAVVEEVLMVCLLIMYEGDFCFHWLPKTISNVKRLNQLVNDFTGKVYNHYEIEGQEIDISSLSALATDDLPHFEVIEGFEVPEELCEFDTIPDQIQPYSGVWTSQDLEVIQKAKELKLQPKQQEIKQSKSTLTVKSQIKKKARAKNQQRAKN